MVDNSGREDDLLSVFFSCLASRSRRRLLRVINDQAPTSITREELATALASWNFEKPQNRVTAEEHQEAMITLHHVHLPKLEAAKLIELDTDEDSITITDHPGFEDISIQKAITDEESAESQSLNALFAALADARQRTVLDVLSHQYQPIQTETLAREVIVKEQGIAEQDVPPEVITELLILFRHKHLPTFQKAGLIEYDAEDQTVAYEGHPLLRVPWVHSQVGPDFRASLTTSSKDEDVWTLKGRENIVSYGQSLCEEADEELFMMFTTTGLLESGCVTRIKQAVDQGVNVYLGTCDPTIQEFVRENTPEVTLWEPQENWLNLPVEDKKVGRLVFADREAILVGTLGKKHDEDVSEEQAIAGGGAENSLVVLMRQMLTSQFNQIDKQSDDLESHLPF